MSVRRAVSGCRRGLVGAAIATLGLALPPPATAALADETALAERFAPVIRLVEQAEECGPGEPYEPIDVDLLFDEPTVALRGPWNAADLVEIAPSARDVAGLWEYHLDFPGHALEPGCDYERWARRLTEGQEPTVFAHVATDPGHPGKLALQYWFFYAYNDWNNLHEGDWEMIQLVFDASDAREALSREPTAVGFSQHEGGEQADWGDEKLEIVDGSHPVVRPAAGSHANFFSESLWLGSSAEQGVGCDDTQGPTRDVRPSVLTLPSDPSEAGAEFPWIAYEGRWGELQSAFYNGPTGPNLKTQWTEPILWSGGWRDRSLSVPTASLFGTSATDFFCSVVGGGSRALVQLANRPAELGLLIAGILGLVAYLLVRATWTPVAPLRVARRRTWGQVLSATGRMYVGRFGLFVGIGVLFLPVAAVVTLLQALALGASNAVGLQTGGTGSGVLAFFVVAIGTTLTLFGLGLAQAATVRALVEVDRGRTTSPVHAYRLASESIRPLLAALVVTVAVLSLLASSVFLLPVAVWLAGRLALVVPVATLEGASATAALRRSSHLVRGRWLKVASLIVAGAALALVTGPLVGMLLILTTDAPFWLVNLIAGVIYTVTMPLVALATAYTYFDARVRDELAPEAHKGDLPAEIELSG
jgi:hypothetical protein